MNHNVGRAVFALVVGLAVAFLSYRWITNPDDRAERAIQVTVVRATQEYVRFLLGDINIEIVDPLLPNRKVGKVYVFREGNGWSVSGYYRRNEDDRWHPYLASLDADLQLIRLKVQDDADELQQLAASDRRLIIAK